MTKPHAHDPLAFQPPEKGCLSVAAFAVLAVGTVGTAAWYVVVAMVHR